MLAEHLWEWLQEHWEGEGERESATTTEDSDPEGWGETGQGWRAGGVDEWDKTKSERVVELVQTAFWGGVLVE